MAGYFPIGSNFPEFPGWTHDSGNTVAVIDYGLDYGLLVELAWCDHNNYFSNINLLHPMRYSIKQQNTFTTIAVANFQVIASYRGCYEWF